MKPLRVFEAFSGIGTQHMALKRLGIPFEVVAISEIDSHAVTAYEAIHGKANNLGSIMEIDEATVPDHDLFTYSFPCQDISKDGKLGGLTRGSGTRSSLLWDAMRIVEHKKPTYLLAENVRNLVSKRFKAEFDEYVAYLDSIGYNTYYRIVNSIGYIPQNRERVFIVSILKEQDDGSFRFPEKEATQTTLLDILEERVGEDYALSETLENKLVWRHDGPHVVGQALKIRNATILGYALAEHGDGVEFAYATSKTRRGRVQKQRAQTMTTHASLGVMLWEEGSYRLRYLTEREYWRLMDIADADYDKAEQAVPQSVLYHLAGNAIVVGVLEDIFRSLFTNENNNEIIGWEEANDEV